MVRKAKKKKKSWWEGTENSTKVNGSFRTEKKRTFRGVGKRQTRYGVTQVILGNS